MFKGQRLNGVCVDIATTLVNTILYRMLKVQTFICITKKANEMSLKICVVLTPVPSSIQ